VSGNVTWARVSANQWRTCALTTAGSAYCWGDGYGTVPRAVPGGLALSAITTGGYHACALTAAGVAYCWGSNSFGQLGRAVAGDTAVPAPVAGNHIFTAIAAGWSHTCALDAGGAAWCWGDNRYGQVGVPASATPVAAPIAVSGGLKLAAVSAGGFSSCGLTAGGAAWCWGVNWGGQLGIGNPGLDSSATPLPVTGGLTFTALSTGDLVGCGLAPGGQAYCWGHTSAVDDFARWAPTPVAGTLAFVTISVGGRAPCGLASDGYVYCWGMGELGSGWEGSSDVPVRVLGQR
jgi:alpha-tubulin suppressor-like RCC1 family protein